MFYKIFLTATEKNPCPTHVTGLSHNLTPPRCEKLFWHKRRETPNNFICHSGIWLWGSCLSGYKTAESQAPVYWCVHADSVGNSSIAGGFLKPWLFKEASRRKISFFFLFRLMCLSQEEGWSFTALFNMKLCKDYKQNGNAHQCRNGNWLRFSPCFISYITQKAGDNPFGGGSATSSELSALIGKGDASGM